MSRPVLYSFRRCPYAMRARLALQASGLEVELREIHLKHKPAAMLEASPKGTVPVLVLPDKVLEESLDVAFWALRAADPEGWLSPWQENRDAADALLARNDGPFKHHLDRYKYASRYEDVDASEHRAEGLKVLEDLNARLEKTGYLGGEYFTFLDAGIAPFVRQFRIPDKDWFDDLPLPSLLKWLHDFMESERFAGVMAKYKLWESGSEGVTFPKPDQV
ncbi:glutathione S-transferase [Ponticaulis sp.]|uniref:glutathione S-transferase n=1 Tax=Ponticaulis sp. TaxID=2020902 RepID=UPI000B69C706|nr:glutathione S-transferase [Ponticaulis sp.]MAI90248.1 glutathione S-transferase [Ponticaulis sp.]OUX99894.1 MAG: glutathione S-transferase [Hyphomonadaceae bacterium TMED5]